jgi:hypothetical protein
MLKTWREPPAAPPMLQITLRGPSTIRRKMFCLWHRETKESSELIKRSIEARESHKILILDVPRESFPFNSCISLGSMK